MQSSHGNWAELPEKIANGTVAVIPSDEIFVQTPRGAAVASSRRTDLPDRLRTLLFLINGRRRMYEYRDLLPRYRKLDETFDMLARKGYIERLSGTNSVDQPAGIRHCHF